MFTTMGALLKGSKAAYAGNMNGIEVAVVKYSPGLSWRRCRRKDTYRKCRAINSRGVGCSSTARAIVLSTKAIKMLKIIEKRV
jgi:hypothetical protein